MFTQLDLFGGTEPKMEQVKKPAAQNNSRQKAVSETTVLTINDEPATIKATAVVKVPAKRGRKSNKETYANIDDIEFPSDETLDQKLYYSISETASFLKITSSQIRYWENEFDIIKPRKNRKGDRLFRAEDIKNLKTVYYLLRIKKYSIEGAKEYLKSNQEKTELHLHLSETLTHFRSFLLEMKNNLRN